ncbi:hypothetical protein [Bartonella rattaustraliani]|uniref:hypothetical protein n=1 Tax=Bartonella rattaustraliani TaxID=481139 RepID=UPI0002DBB0DA|nr:hypothetical protein [Bartonella rattaustraliani]
MGYITGSLAKGFTGTVRGTIIGAGILGAIGTASGTYVFVKNIQKEKDAAHSTDLFIQKMTKSNDTTRGNKILPTQ